MKLIVWMIQDAESVRSGHSHVTSQPVSFPPHPIPGRMPSRSVGMPSRRDGPPRIWDTHGLSGNVFADPVASSTAPYPQELNQWNSSIEEPLHSSTVEKSERQKLDQDLRCKSGPSAKNSVIFSGGDSLKNYGADQQRLQISDLQFDKFPTPATFACWKIRFKTEVCTCSQFPTEAMHWIQWMILDLRYLQEEFECQILKYSMRRLLQHWTESSIIPASRKRSVWRKKKPKKRTLAIIGNRSLTWSTSTSVSQEPTILSRILPTYLQLFFEWRYSGIRFEMGRNSIINDKDSTWRHLGKIVQIKNTRVWKTQDRIGIVRPGDSSEENRTWPSQIENNGEKKYRARFTK